MIRRPFAGGGTAFYDAGCALMFGVMFPKHPDDSPSVLDERIEWMKPVVLDALARIELGAVDFKGSADLRWQRDRKLGGISAGDFGRVISIGGFLNIAPPNLDLYLQVVRVPDEKFKDKLVSDMRQYVCTAEEVAGHPVSYEDFRDAFTAALGDAGIVLDAQPLTDVEQGALVKISNRIVTDGSVRRISSDRFRAEAPAGARVGFGNHKGKKLARGCSRERRRTDRRGDDGGRHARVAARHPRQRRGRARRRAGRRRVRAACTHRRGVGSRRRAPGRCDDGSDDRRLARGGRKGRDRGDEGACVKIHGASILVTGASSGIGEALAPLLAERGATVGIVARRADRLKAVLERCRKFAPASRMWAADLGDLDRAAAVALEADEAFGGLDVLVNNAAIPKRTRVTDLTPADVQHLMDVDFHSPVRMALAVLPKMVARGRGQVLFVSSTGGRIPIPNESAYCAAKYALCGFAEAMCIDLGGTGVEVKLVLPGPIATEIWDQPENEPALFDVVKVTAEDCAAGIADAIEDDGFEYFVPPVFPGSVDAKAMVVGKSQNCDQYVKGMADFVKTLR